MSLTSASTYSIIVDTKDRIRGTPDDFTVQFLPVIQRVHFIELQSVFLPWLFDNVTVLYGNSLPFNLTSGAGVVAGTVIIPKGFYNIQELLVAVNLEFQRIFNLLPGSPPTPITLSIASIPNRIILNYNATVFTIPATLTFTPPPLNPATHIRPTYLFSMLGLPTNQATSFVFNNPPNINYTVEFPLSVNTQLPISYIMMHIEGLPSKVISSSSTGGQFYIDISGSNIEGKLIALPNSYKAYNDYWNTIELPGDFWNFSELKVFLTDNFGKPVTEQNVIDWHFSFKVTTYPAV